MSVTLEPEVVSGRLRPAQRAVLDRLARVRARLRWHLLVEGVFWVGSALLLAGAVSLALDRLLRFNLPTRLGLLAVAAVVILVVVVRRLIVPLLLPLEDLDLADLLDRRAPGVGQQISNVLELPDLLAADRHVSPGMVQAAVAECAASLDRVDLLATLNVQRRRKLLATCGLWLLLVLGFCAIWPAAAGLWARRWLAGSTVRWPQQTYLRVEGLTDDGRLLVPRGEITLLQIGAQPKFVESGDHWLLAGRDEPLVVEGDKPPESHAPAQVSIAYTASDGSRRRGNAEQFEEHNFRYELPPLAEPTDLHIAGGDDWLGPITVEPIERPAVSTLEITARRAGSAQAETLRVGEGSEQLLFLPQTALELRLVANGPLASAEVLDEGLNVAGWQRVDERTYTLSWTMTEPLALEFRLISAHGALSSKPYFLAVGLLKDREPRVTIHPSGVGRRVTPVARIPLAVRAIDDFGVATLALDYERTAMHDDKPQVETKRQELGDSPGPAPPESAAKEVDLKYELALGARGLAPGNLLKLRAVATDHCVLGTQTGNSRWLLFQVVSSEELFYEILMRQREQRARFTALLESAKAQSKTLSELAQGADAFGVARAEQLIARGVWQTANLLEQTLQEMTLNDLGNPQARENLQSTIIAPLRELHGGVLVELRTEVDNLTRQQAISAEGRARAVGLSDRSVAAMQAILAQMSLWESFIDVINQLKQVIDRQGGVLKDTQEIEKERTNKLFDE